VWKSTDNAHILLSFQGQKGLDTLFECLMTSLLKNGNSVIIYQTVVAGLY